MRTVFLLLLINVWFSASAKDYSAYHQSIVKCEQLIFAENKFDSGINLYQKTFEFYDFVYAGDCVTAIQIALYHNDEKAFLSFTKKAFQNGLMLRNFKRIYYVKHHPLYLKDTSQFEKIYRENRPHYLARIDTATLKKMYTLYAKDQLVKNSLKKPGGTFESSAQYLKRYRPLITKTIAEFKNLVVAKGLPADRIIGIGQKDIMRELKTSAKDMEQYYWDYKSNNECVLEKGQFDCEEESLFSNLAITLMIHYGNPLEIFDASFYLNQIKLGNLHPKDFATFQDIKYACFTKEMGVIPTDLYFGVGVTATLAPNNRLQTDHYIDSCRSLYFIAPIEQDRLKWKFMQAQKMNYGWGYAAKRS